MADDSMAPIVAEGAHRRLRRSPSRSPRRFNEKLVVATGRGGGRRPLVPALRPVRPAPRREPERHPPSILDRPRPTRGGPASSTGSSGSARRIDRSSARRSPRDKFAQARGDHDLPVPHPPGPGLADDRLDGGQDVLSRSRTRSARPSAGTRRCIRCRDSGAAGSSAGRSPSPRGRSRRGSRSSRAPRGPRRARNGLTRATIRTTPIARSLSGHLGPDDVRRNGPVA